MDLFQTLRIIAASVGSGVASVLPGTSNFRMCTFTVVTALLCYVTQKLSGDMGITCDEGPGGINRFATAICKNLASLMISFRCWETPNRLKMKEAGLHPHQFGTTTCFPDEDDERNEWFAYWQHEWSSLYFLLMAAVMSSPKYLWKSWERGLMAGLIRSQTGGLVMRRSDEYDNLSARFPDYLEAPGLAREYVAWYFLTLVYGLVVSVAMVAATVAFLPSDQFLYYGVDMVNWAFDTSANAALNFFGFSDAELFVAKDHLPSFLLLFPPAGLCPLTLSGASGTGQNRMVVCAINNSRFSAPAYFILWWALALAVLEKSWAILRMLLVLAYYPTGWLLRRLSFSWTLSGTMREMTNVKGLLRKTTFSQFIFLELLIDLMEPQAFADLMDFAQTERSV